MKSKRAFLTDIRKIEYKDVEVTCGVNEIMIRVDVCGLCHWEMNHWKGLMGPFPLPIGHEVSGHVCEVGEGVGEFQIGDRVTAFYTEGYPDGFSEYVSVKAETCVKLPDNIPMDDAVLEPAMCVVNVLRQAKPETGDHAVIIGCGCMGLWAIQLLSGNSLASLTAVDFNEERLELAKKYGATDVINPSKENTLERLECITNGHLADFVIEGTGKPSVLNESIAYLRHSGGGKLLMMSSHDKPMDELDLRVGILKSCVLIVAHGGLSNDRRDDMRRAVELVSAGKLNIHDMITNRYGFEELEQGFKDLEHQPEHYLKGMVRIGQGE